MPIIAITHPSVDYIIHNQHIQQYIEKQKENAKVLDLSVTLANIDITCMDDNIDQPSFFRGMTLAQLSVVKSIDYQQSETNILIYNPFSYSIFHDNDYLRKLLNQHFNFDFTFSFVWPNHEDYMKAVEEEIDDESAIRQMFMDDKETFDSTMDAFAEEVKKLNIPEGATEVSPNETIH